jgi:hypothetical protein
MRGDGAWLIDYSAHPTILGVRGPYGAMVSYGIWPKANWGEAWPRGVAVRLKSGFRFVRCK